MVQNQPMMMQDNPFDNDGPIWVTDFNAEATKAVCDAILKASAMDPLKPIVLYINTPGGEVSGLTSMLAVIDAIPNKVITVAMGYAMSAGCFLLAHGDVRLASPYARIMVHKIQAGAFGNMDDISNETEELVRLNKMILEVFAKDTKKTLKEVEDSVIFKRELYMSPEDAKAYGIIDVIGIPRVEMTMTPSYNIQIVAPETEARAQQIASGVGNAKPKKTKKQKKKKKLPWI